MSATRYAVRRRAYFDSILLMRVARALGEQPGVASAAALMATEANKATLRQAGYGGPEVDRAGPDDLVAAVTAAAGEQAEAALGRLDGLLNPAVEARAGSTASLDEALAQQPRSNLAVVSTPGDYAAAEVRRALERGLHVFCFSSNVALDDEIALKRLAGAGGLLLMGPDCGTAIIAGKGLGFSNAVRRGPIGLVGASGTGLQAISSLVHQAGSGVSHALGTGSRDLTDEVGGLSTGAALRALLLDPGTAVVVLVSKKPGPGTLAALRSLAEAAPKPVVSCFLGEAVPGAASTLEEAACLALERVGRALPRFTGPRPVKAQGRLLGLFAGGSLLQEAATILAGSGLDPGAFELADLGSEELTRGRPHPMIDPRARIERINGADPGSGVAALLLDVVLGYGAAPDPAGDLAPAIRAAGERGLVVVASVVGTDGDPQGLAAQQRKLREAGAHVLATSARAARYAAEVVS